MHRPSLAICEPAAMVPDDAPLLAATAMNALAHAIESLYAPFANPVTEEAALRSARLFADALPRDPAPAPALAEAAFLAGYAVGNAGLAVHHAVCQTIVRTCGTPHAQTNAVMLPHSVRLMSLRAPGEIGRLASALGDPPRIPRRPRAGCRSWRRARGTRGCRRSGWRRNSSRTVVAGVLEHPRPGHDARPAGRGRAPRPPAGGAVVRVLFATMPFDGHFKPLTGLAVHLKELGHDVRWYTGPSYAQDLRDLGIPHLPFRRAREVNGENIADVFPERAKLSGPKLIAFEFEHIFVANVEAHFRDIEGIRREFDFDVVFADDGLYAVKLIAEKLGVTVYAAGVSPLMFNSRDAPPNFFGLKPAKTPLGKLRDRIVGKMIDGTMKKGAEQFNALLEAEGIAPLGAPRDFFDIPAVASTLFFQSGAPGFAYPRTDLPGNVRFVGPLLPHKRTVARELPHEDRLRSADSVIVVSQGTVDNKDPGKLIAPALEALTGTEHLVVATTGGRHTAELRDRFPAENLLIEDFVDFDLLLPRARLFICNGGYGSILLSIVNGVPVLTAGKREGKNDINAHVDFFGVGIDLRTEQPSPRKVGRGVDRILTDRRYGERVERLRAELEAYDPHELVTRALV